MDFIYINQTKYLMSSGIGYLCNKNKEIQIIRIRLVICVMRNLDNQNQTKYLMSSGIGYLCNKKQGNLDNQNQTKYLISSRIG